MIAARATFIASHAVYSAISRSSSALLTMRVDVREAVERASERAEVGEEVAQ
jgi:hypothetical protein